MHCWLKTNCNCSFVFFLKHTAFHFDIWMKEPLHSTYRYADQYNYTIANELLIMVLQTLCILCRAKLPCDLWEAYSHVGLHWERGKFVELPEDYSWIFSTTLWIIGKLCWASSVLGVVLCLWMLETMLENSSQAANEQHNLKKQCHSSSTWWGRLLRMCYLNDLETLFHCLKARDFGMLISKTQDSLHNKPKY